MLIKIRTKLGKIKIILFFTKLKWRTGYSLNIVIFPKFSKPLPHQHSAAIGCTKNYQSIGVTVHSHCVEHFECLLQRCRRGRGCSELWKKNLEHPVGPHLYLAADWEADWKILKIRFVFVSRAPYTNEKPVPTPNLKLGPLQHLYKSLFPWLIDSMSSITYWLTGSLAH